MKNEKNFIGTLMKALERLQNLVAHDSRHIVHTSQVSRADREWLVRQGWLIEILRGWYLVVRPDLRPGDSTAWYSCFWEFLSVYLSHHYGSNYCLSAESSLDMHLGSMIIPKQVIVLADGGSGSPQALLYDTSLLVYRDPTRIPNRREVVKGLQMMSLPYALCRVSPTFFRASPVEAEIALRAVRPSELLQVIAEHGLTQAAGRLVGAYQFLKLPKVVEELKSGLEQAGMMIHEENPFQSNAPILRDERRLSPYATRILAKWALFRSVIIDHFPAAPGLPRNHQRYLDGVSEIYTRDAYHSLSIEGYRVTPELIEKVKAAKWHPDLDEGDRELRNALAARGYYEAFQAVSASMERILKGEFPGVVAEDDLSKWYGKLFSPSVQAGLVPASELFGYRQSQVYISGSRHTPPAKEYLSDCMEAFFKCLKEEEHAGVRAVLGHFIFVYIHPYMDGNGRLGRFLMNLMLASGGYPWTIIEETSRSAYLKALEAASVEGDILPFTRFVQAAMQPNRLP